MGESKSESPRRTFATSGLERLGLWDFRVRILDPELTTDAEHFARSMVQYQQETGNRIEPNQTVTYGYWTTKFVPGDDGLLDLWEVKSEAESDLWVPYLDRALRYRSEQTKLCARVGASFAPPHASQTVAISEGVLEGVLPIEGVRYPSRDPVSGWYLSTDLYDGNWRNMRVIHLEHLTERRPELLAVLALPFGYRFELTADKPLGVWFDPNAAGREVT